MMYHIEPTTTGRYGLVDGSGKTVHLFDSQLSAQTACDFKNRESYEPVIDPYYPAGRWTERWKERAA